MNPAALRANIVTTSNPMVIITANTAVSTTRILQRSWVRDPVRWKMESIILPRVSSGCDYVAPNAIAECGLNQESGSTFEELLCTWTRLLDV